MPANHRSPKKRSRSGPSGPSGRTTPKGTRPPGADRRAGGDAPSVDHHLDVAAPKDLHGRSAPPNALRQRSGHRGGRPTR
ncbi:hypothetical protein [Aquihabitans sp. McL0605]|uniref:hypothetical protein n=1 Tax=Aquihabitans sp. McL0605 TaxID=3415671 RepID=UPI003CF26ABB